MENWRNVPVVARKDPSGHYAPDNLELRAAASEKEARMGLEEWSPDEPDVLPMTKAEKRERRKLKTAMERWTFDVHHRMGWRARLSQPLPPILRALARWTYEVVGRFSQATWERWEAALRRDVRPEELIEVWLKTATAFRCYLQAQGRDEKAVNKEEGFWLVSFFVEPKPVPVSRFDEVRDDAARARLIALNHREPLNKLKSFLQSEVQVPTEFIESVEDESVRSQLHEFNVKARTNH